jgi:hypothetical protein
LLCFLLVLSHSSDRDHSRGVSCFLEHSELLGYIATSELSDNYIEHPAEVVAADETVLGRITEINREKFNVRVTYGSATGWLLFGLLCYVYLFRWFVSLFCFCFVFGFAFDFAVDFGFCFDLCFRFQFQFGLFWFCVVCFVLFCVFLILSCLRVLTRRCKPSDLRSTRWDPRPSHDPYLIEDASECYPHAELGGDRGESGQRPRQLLKRAIVHPRFKNVDREEAEALLGKDTVPVGDFFFRPSANSYSQLKLSWKFGADVIVHIDVKELDKPNNNNWSLGRRLQIEEEFYDDLDDVVANFVDSIVACAASVREHRRFKVRHAALVWLLVSVCSFVRFVLSRLYCLSLSLFFFSFFFFTFSHLVGRPQG